jgi:hypothetical protein
MQDNHSVAEFGRSRVGAPAARMTLAIGSRIGMFEITGTLGVWGMARCIARAI